MLNNLESLINLEKLNDTSQYLTQYYLPEVKILSFNYPDHSSSSNLNQLAYKLNTRFNWFAFSQNKLENNGIFQYTGINTDKDLYQNCKNFIGNYLNLSLHGFESLAKLEPSHWLAYKVMNEKIALSSQYASTNSIPNVFWLNNFELALAPAFIPKQKGTIICQFIDTSWPKFNLKQNYEIWKSITLGLLANNLLGFQNSVYCENFLTYVEALIPQAKISHNQVVYKGHKTGLIANPIGIDFRQWQKVAKLNGPHAAILKKEHKLANQIVLGVDKLCPSKGIIEKLAGFSSFLEKNKAWHKRIHLVQILGKPDYNGIVYEDYARQVDSAIDNINSRFGVDNWQPIKVIKDKLSQNELSAWYQASDVLLLNSLSCGVNLVAKEYVASRVDEQGVLILSQNMAYANGFDDSVLVSNPQDAENIGKMLEIALALDPEEKKRRINTMRYAVNYNQLQDWVVNFIDSAIKVA